MHCLCKAHSKENRTIERFYYRSQRKEGQVTGGAGMSPNKVAFLLRETTSSPLPFRYFTLSQAGQTQKS
jgi:hypothetical protein